MLYGICKQSFVLRIYRPVNGLWRVLSVTLNPQSPGPSCSKLTMSLVNDSLNFTLIRKYAAIFCWKNVSSFCYSHFFQQKISKYWKNVSSFCYSHFSAKNIIILYIESAKTVKEMTLNKPVKLTTLWSTGPRLASNSATKQTKLWINCCIYQSEPLLLYTRIPRKASSHLLGQKSQEPQSERGY